MATAATDLAPVQDAPNGALNGGGEVLPEIAPIIDRPTRGDPLPRHLERHIPLVSMVTHLAGYTPPEPAAYKNPGGKLLFDMVFRTCVERFASEPPPVLPVQDMPGPIGGLPPLRLEHFSRDFAGVDNATPAGNLALAIEVKTEEWSLFVPIAPGIDPDTADNLVLKLTGREGDFLDMDFIESEMRASGEQCTSMAASWVIAPAQALGEWFAEQQIQPEALMLFRQGGAWDRVRSELADVTPHWMPPFDDEAFEKAIADGLTADRARLDELFANVLVAHRQLAPSSDGRWEHGVEDICALLEPLGRPRPDKMAVVVDAVRYETGGGSFVEIARETVCVGVALDLHQARALHEVVAEEPARFVQLTETDVFVEIAESAMMVPAATLSRLGARTDRRLPDGYQEFAASINSVAGDAAQRRIAAAG